jgi:hypothetical protein
MSLLSRRTFLQAAFAAIASFLLPRGLFAKGNNRQFWFLHTATGESWPVDDPVSWSLENAGQPILERARQRLVTLDASDPQRVIRLVVRRCKLNLIEIRPGHVVVHHWGKQSQGDLRPFFKQHHLAHKGIQVTLIDRKPEVSTHKHGCDFLYGDRLLPFWPLNVIWLKLYWTKWQRRWDKEPDDWTAAPDTWSGFGWKGIEPNCIPWVALKCVWRRTTPMLCLNCDEPTILVNFGLPQCSMFNREARFIHACRKCRRLFHDHSVSRWKVGEWIVTNLDAEFWPDFDIFWGKPSKWEPPVSS